MRRPRGGPAGGGAVMSGRVLVVVALLLAPGLVRAQDEGEPPGEGEGPAARAGERLLLPIDEEAQSALERAEGLARRGQWDRAVKLLDGLLTGGGASVLPGDPPVSVRAAARQRLLALPPDGRAAWALVHEDAAQGLLEQARGRVDPGPLEALVQLHPASPLASRARRMLLARAIEAGDAAAALEQADALLAAPELGEDERRQAALVRALCLALLDHQGEAQTALEAALPAGPELTERRRALAGLAAPAPAPVADAAAVAWSRETFGFYEVDATGSPAWSEPEADGELVYAHDASHAVAVRLDSGLLRWRVPLRPEDAFLRPEGPCRLAIGPAVVACALPGVRGGVVGLDRATGRERWRADVQALRLAAALDLPATVEQVAAAGPLVAVLLVTDHEQREVHLVALDAGTGAPRFTAFVAGRQGGAAPRPLLVAADGRLLVVSGLGAASAFDLAGELRWMRRYRSLRDPENWPKRGGGIRGLPNVQVDGEQMPQGPPDRTPSCAVARGLLWAAPADARDLLAWDARTGEVRAALVDVKADRIVGPREAGVVVYTSDGNLVHATRAGARTIAGLGHELTGRPALLGDRAWLPRADGVVEVELATGKARRVATAADLASAHGHLLAAGGRLVVSRARGLVATGAAAGEAPPLPGDVEGVVAALGDARFATREAASSVLVGLGEKSRPALEARRETGRDSDGAELRLRVVTVLAELDRRDRLVRWRPIVQPEWEAEVPDLLVRLTHPNPEVRLEALRALGGLERDDVTALLRELLTDADPRVQFAAAAALLGKKDRAGIELLAKAVTDGLPSDQQAAVAALGAHGAPEDFDRVLPALRSGSPDVRIAAAAAAAKLGGDRALAHVGPLLDDKDEQVRLAIIGALAAGPIGDGVIALLAKAVEDESGGVRSVAVDRLVKDDVDGRAAAGALGKALGDEVQSIAATAASRLSTLLQRLRDPSIVPPDMLERGARFTDEALRDKVAQLAIRRAGQDITAERGISVSVETLCRFASDPWEDPDTKEKDIRRLRVTVPGHGRFGWGELLLVRAKEAPLDAADVAAITSLVEHAEADLRIKGHHTLSRAMFAPGAGRLVAQGLDDAVAAIRTDCALWLQGKDGATPGLLDDEALDEVLRLACTSPRPESRALAEEVLASVKPGTLIEALLRALRPGTLPALRIEAGKRLAARSKVPFDARGDARAAYGAQAVWWWRETHPGRTLEEAAKALQEQNPSIRWRAAQELGSLPVAYARNALAASLDEPLDWVLQAKLEALAAVTGQRFGYKKGLAGDALRACAQQARLWVGARIQEEARTPSR